MTEIILSLSAINVVVFTHAALSANRYYLYLLNYIVAVVAGFTFFTYLPKL